MFVMEILDRYETAKVIDGRLQFHCIKFIIKQGEDYYIGKWQDRKQQPNDLSDLQDVKLIPTKERGPALQRHWTMKTSSDNSYVKKPSPEDYLDMELETKIEREIEICELLRQYPHPNLAGYNGCVTMEGQFVGLSFKKYEKTLVDELDPQRLSKRCFIKSKQSLVEEHMSCWVEDLRSAIQHLHSLGLVHNDINPANVTLDQNKTPVIIDFGSICQLGQSPQGIKRTYGWHDGSVTHAARENDSDALKELETWLFGSLENLKFA